LCLATDAFEVLLIPDNSGGFVTGSFLSDWLGSHDFPTKVVIVTIHVSYAFIVQTFQGAIHGIPTFTALFHFQCGNDLVGVENGWKIGEGSNNYFPYLLSTEMRNWFFASVTVSGGGGHWMSPKLVNCSKVLTHIVSNHSLALCKNYAIVFAFKQRLINFS